MNRVRTTAGVGAATAMLAFGWLAAGPPVLPARQDPPEIVLYSGPPITDLLRAGLTGSAGCSGVACHGGPVNGLVPPSAWGIGDADRERWRSSATLWKAYDPHARALEVLGNEQSQAIEVRLTKAGEKPLDARSDGRCLACHANPLAAPRPNDYQPMDARRAALLEEGVSCEACHGNASYWLDKHAGWPAGPRHSERYGPPGPTRLSDPSVRAETCAGCHVGAPAGMGAPLRDMNHDLIAAGHPRLNFDYGTYLRALPPHWAEKDRDVSPPKLRPASDEFRHWRVGRGVMLIASYRLLADRAARGPWPELAEFDCYACHHGLTGEKKEPLGHRPGALVWNEPPLTALFAGPDMRTTMRQPLDTGAIQRQAEAIAEKAMTGPTTPAEVAAKLAEIKPRRWDEACHLYYALVAIDRATDPTRSKPEDPRLSQIRAALKLPREADGVRFNSPRGLELDKLPFADLVRTRAR